MGLSDLCAALSRMGLHVPLSSDRNIIAALCQPRFTGFIEPADPLPCSFVEDLIELAKKFSVAPISGYKVGALAVGQSGRYYLGANMEFIGAPLQTCLHAEQSAVINAWHHGERVIQALCISEVPCGHCRQFLYELPGAADLPITVKGNTRTLAELLPQAFLSSRPEDENLLNPTPIKSLRARPDDSQAAQNAIGAASRSYAPYSRSPEGCSIETESGLFFVGRHAESFAFNPTVPAVISALNQLNLSAQRKERIWRCALARLSRATACSAPLAQTIIHNLYEIPVEQVLIDNRQFVS